MVAPKINPENKDIMPRAVPAVIIEHVSRDLTDKKKVVWPDYGRITIVILVSAIGGLSVLLVAAALGLP